MAPKPPPVVLAESAAIHPKAYAVHGVVPEVGLEPTHLAVLDFESHTSKLTF